jgi:hypothetical protein
MVLAVSQQLAGLAIIYTYSTCMLHGHLLLSDESSLLTRWCRLLRSRWFGRPIPRLCHPHVSYSPAAAGIFLQLIPIQLLQSTRCSGLVFNH